MDIRNADTVLAALDRRLQVERIAMIDALAPAARPTDASRQPPATPTPSNASAAARAPAAAADIVDQLPLGRVIAARVVDLPRAGLVVAEVGDLRVEMAWPPGSTPRAGDDIALRVLANRPALLFERVVVEAGADTPGIEAAVGDTEPRLSSDALRLQARPDAANGRAATPTRFDVPILATGAAPSPTPGSAVDADAPIALDGVRVAHDPADVDGADVGTSRRSNDGSAPPAPFGPPTAIDRAATANRPDVPIPTTGLASSPLPGAAVAATPIAADGAVVAHDTSTVGGADVAGDRRSTAALPAAFVPPASPGPAWSRQATDAVLPTAADGMVLAGNTSTVDGSDVAANRRQNEGTAAPPAAFVPLVLQGPAWVGQAMELIVHRERRDEALDDPVLDQWCGEVLIELPNLGRVAGHLAFSMQGLRLRLEGDDEHAVSVMTAAAAELARALTGADLRVSAVSVGRPTTAVARDG